MPRITVHGGTSNAALDLDQVEGTLETSVDNPESTGGEESLVGISSLTSPGKLETNTAKKPRGRPKRVQSVENP